MITSNLKTQFVNSLLNQRNVLNIWNDWVGIICIIKQFEIKKRAPNMHKLDCNHFISKFFSNLMTGHQLEITKLSAFDSLQLCVNNKGWLGHKEIFFANWYMGRFFIYTGIWFIQTSQSLTNPNSVKRTYTLSKMSINISKSVNAIFPLYFGNTYIYFILNRTSLSLNQHFDN